jgi:hypothetical protein
MRTSLAGLRSRVERLATAVRERVTCSACWDLPRIFYADGRAEADAIRRQPLPTCERCGRQLRRVVHIHLPATEV